MLTKPYRNIELSRANTAHIFMLTSLELYQDHSPANYHFAAIQTWQEKESDKKHYYSRLCDENSNNYYVSHPPMAFLANHFIFKALNLNPSEKILKNIAFILLLGGAIMLFFIAKLTISIANSNYAILAGLLALSFYIFNPVNLYAHIFHNFSEIWGQFFLISSLLSLLLYFNSNNTRASIILFSISTFALAYSDWMGISFILALILVLFKERKKKYIKHLILAASISAIVATTLCFIQYVQIAGFNPLFKAVGIRFVERSGFFGNQYTDMGYHILNPETWLLFLYQIHNVLIGPGYIILLLIIIKFIFFKKLKFKSGKTSMIALLSAAIFALIVFSATATHYIYMARFTPFLALIGANLAIHLIEITKNKALLTNILIILLPLSLFLSMKTLKEKAIYPDLKQTELNLLAKEIKSKGIHKLELSDGLEERDIIYLTYITKQNLVWRK